MPVAEATTGSEELTTYELAFHVLPTVAEGEVNTVVEKLKSEIAAAGGTIIDEEAAERIELAYEVVKHYEGRNRKFKSAYFGWVRFTAESAAIPTLEEEVGGIGDILRHMLVKLTREEVAEPFRYHEAMTPEQSPVATVDIDAAVAEANAADEAAEAADAEEADEPSEPEATDEAKD